MRYLGPVLAGAVVWLAPLAAASELSDLIERYSADRGTLARYYSPPMAPGGARFGGGLARGGRAEDASPAQRARFRQFYGDWLGRLERVDFDKLDQEGRIDYVLFRHHLQHEIRQLTLDAKSSAETGPLVPFAEAVVALEEARRRMDVVEPAKAAAAMDALRRQILAARKKLENADKILANRAAAEVDALRNRLRGWFSFYNGYDPLFTWWVETPYKQTDKALEEYTGAVREKAGLRAGDPTAIVGNPIGREALLEELANEMIPYSPEELIEIANKEFAWCETEMKKASRELGYGDDWHKALEYVKTKYVEPGKQPALIRDLALQAIDFVQKRDLVTIPELARDTWRMEMMSPERQLVNPFFTGGETISVSYPSSSMTNEQKLMSMRGNNIHFSHATVFHELIPGHELQLFMAARYRPYRSLFSTPFLTEGWALYWEMLLWDLNFNTTPEDRVGALFWRMHRCARIIFSLSFHLKKMTPEECIDLLVNRVGHERENAAGEVRRSFNGSYPPLYQAAYMLGGLQLRALHRELVDSGKMTNRAFHDAVLRENRIPVEMIRASLANQALARDFRSHWRFYDAAASR